MRKLNGIMILLLVIAEELTITQKHFQLKLRVAVSYSICFEENIDQSELKSNPE
jgi:hypothetical protein